MRTLSLDDAFIVVSVGTLQAWIFHFNLGLLQLQIEAWVCNSRKCNLLNIETAHYDDCHLLPCHLFRVSEDCIEGCLLHF